MTNSNNRPYDVVLYGATGFVGQQTVAYFAAHAAGVRFAVAGRNEAKLRAVLKSCKIDVPIIVADAQDTAALGALAASARVVLSSAGPYALYGSPLVAACVAAKTHYVDLTGESPWIRSMIDAHHSQAAKDGTRIIPGCGFDSIPSDIGAYLVVQEMLRQHGQPCVTVKASYSIRGGLNGGTLASVLNIMEKGQKEAFNAPFLLNPAGSIPTDQTRHADPVAPMQDADFQSWLGPFFMGPINTRVVRRSAALMQAAGDSAYGADFFYQEYMRFGSGALAAMAAAGMSAGSLASQSMLAFAPARRMMARFLPKPGEGPSERSMDNGSFRCQLIGKSANGHVVKATVADKGDPGNRATTKFICESALALVQNFDDLPGGFKRGGVITPAYALGDVIVRRLRAAGMTIEVNY